MGSWVRPSFIWTTQRLNGEPALHPAENSPVHVRVSPRRITYLAPPVLPWSPYANHDFLDCLCVRVFGKPVALPTERVVTHAGVPERTGRPTKLTDEIQEKILAAARGHQRVEVAAELAGITRQTFYNWLRIAARANAHLAKGGSKSDLTSNECRYVEFSEALTQALAAAEGKAVHHVLAAGSRPSVETKRMKRYVGLDANGLPIYAEETTITERPPDWRADAWWLENGPTLRGQYGSKRRVELTGPGGGPLELEFIASLEALEAKIRGAQGTIAVECQEAE